MNTSSQMQWHRKPSSGLCEICGIGSSLRKGVLHRAYTADEAFSNRAPYVKSVKVCFGMDSSEIPLDWDGKNMGR